jgi:SnoaL-like domain
MHMQYTKLCRVSVCISVERRGSNRVDNDLEQMSQADLIGEVQRLRAGIRQHRDSSGHDLCWYHPDLWALLPEQSDPLPEVPAWPHFMQGCVRYRTSLDLQLPEALRVDQLFQSSKGLQLAPELIELLARYYQASAESDADFLAEYLSRDTGALVVGTAAEEWWQGGEEIIATWGAAWRSRGGSPIVGSNPQAFREGAVGWLADQARWVQRDGHEIPFRLTAVFHQEGQTWKLVQAHYSIAMPNG